MPDRFMLSAYAVLNGTFPLKYEVGGSDAVSFVLGQLPDALEIQLDYDAMRQLAEATTAALAEMKARYTELLGEEPEDGEEGITEAGNWSLPGSVAHEEPAASVDLVGYPR
jgi:hypothetical protein